MTSKEIDKYETALREISVMCKCGRRVYIYKNKKFGICSWCGNKVLSKKEQFKDKLIKILETKKMKVFKRRKQKINIKKEILAELREIHSILENEQSENQKLYWLLLNQDNDIRKLKEKNKELTKQLKEGKNNYE